MKQRSKEYKEAKELVKILNLQFSQVEETINSILEMLRKKVEK